MNGVEIRKQIDFNNNLIQQSLTPNIFTLNNTVATLLAENQKLQQQCQHEFNEGFCIYCDLAQE